MLNTLFQKTFLNNTVLDYTLFIFSFLAGVLAVRLLNAVILHRVREWSKKTSTTIDDFLIRVCDKNLLPMFYYGAFYLSTRILNIPPAAVRVIEIAGLVLLTILGIRLLVSLLNYALEVYWVKKEIDAARQRNLKGIMTVIKVLVWGLGIALLLDNLGYRISAVIAGLGIGGIAVALAAQTILGDLFSYFSIFFDRPFETGDFIIVDDYLGSVEHIGIKTTRLRSLSGEQIIFSNTDLTSSRLRNYKRMDTRRVLFTIGVTYQTPLSQLKEIPELLAEIIRGREDSIFDRAHFFSYGDFSLIFEVVYYVKSKDYGVYMDIQQEINFAIMDEFEKRGIEFAYPTQTLYVEKSGLTGRAPQV
jgi:small-conductance mechanosensitive channel